MFKKYTKRCMKEGFLCVKIKLVEIASILDGIIFDMGEGDICLYYTAIASNLDVRNDLQKISPALIGKKKTPPHRNPVRRSDEAL